MTDETRAKYQALLESGAISRAEFDRVTADHMGMLATVMNALCLKDAFSRAGIEAVVHCSVDMQPFAGKFNRDIVAFAEKKLAESGIAAGNVTYIAVGKRISALLTRKKSEIAEAYAVSNSVKNISLILIQLI